MAQNGILILTTGGTIDKNYFDALSEYQIVDSGIPALLKEARTLEGQGKLLEAQAKAKEAIGWSN